jgi:hypothetical protein
MSNQAAENQDGTSRSQTKGHVQRLFQFNISAKEKTILVAMAVHISYKYLHTTCQVM